MLVSAFPLPLAGADFPQGEESDPLAILSRPGTSSGSEPGSPGETLSLLDAAAIGNARLQLGYPWVETAASVGIPEGLQSPEGLLAGLIARTSLTDGAFRSAAGRPCKTVRRLHPDLGESRIRRGLPGGASDWMGDRLCLVGQKRDRVELLSDATMSPDPQWRAGGVSRLMGIILRAARSFGDDLVFEPSGPALWAAIRSTVETFLEGLRERGALDGRISEEAYEVACDESSMTAADRDSGRVICRIGFTAAYPIQHIEVSLLLLEAAACQVREAA
jgi:phage tail sheath protein FI